VNPILVSFNHLINSIFEASSSACSATSNIKGTPKALVLDLWLISYIQLIELLDEDLVQQVQ